LKDFSVPEKSWLVQLAWSDHPAAEAFNEFSLQSPEVIDGSFYLRERNTFENQDLDLLHDVELLGRSLEESIEIRLNQLGLGWDKVVIIGFGKGAGIALYASLLKVFQKPIAAMILFSPVVLFPVFMGEKIGEFKSTRTSGSGTMKVYSVWGGRNRATPATYRQLLQQTLRKVGDVAYVPDTIQEGLHQFDAKSVNVLTSLLTLVMSQ